MKLLIWGELLNGGPFDIFRRLDYSCIYKELIENYQANISNVGNKVWIQGIVSCLSTKENQIAFLNPNETWEQINTNYDAIIYSAANLLSVTYKSVIADISKIFKNSRIPIYVVSIGAQADSYSDIDCLVNEIKYETKDFVETIYSSGGEIACRGYFTKMVLDKIIYNTASVIGCPSLFQNGCTLYIQKNQKPLRPAFNGLLINDKTLFSEYSDSIFVDQDLWLQESYDGSFYINSAAKVLRILIERKGEFETKLFLKNRIKLFYDIPQWREYLQKEGINFSCGTRIHGNIMAILSGIPSLVLACDSRTQEIAEYFDIPYFRYSNKHLDIRKLYNDVDYSNFNKLFPQKYMEFEQFLISHNLVKKLNQDNIFWRKSSPLLAKNIEIKKEQTLALYNFINLFGSFGRKAFYKTTNKYLCDINFNRTYTKEQYDKIFYL